MSEKFEYSSALFYLFSVQRKNFLPGSLAMELKKSVLR